MAMKLKHFLSKWESITDDPWVLSVIRQGLELEFMVEPSQINMNSTQKLAINREIKRLLAIGCIKEVKRTERLFLSNIFTVPQKNGDLRLVINLKDLNQFLAFHHFKMERFQTAKDLIQEGDWMIKLDLKEAYHSVPVTPDHQRYLAFLWDGKCYVYCVLPFELGPAPRVFTKIRKPILVHVRQNLVIRCIMYLVEWASSSLAFPISDHNNRCCQKRGMGASCNKHKTQGRWTQEEASLHINILELKAALFALKSFAKVYQMTNAHVRLKIDNTPAQAYISHQGRTKSVGLCNQAQELWKSCLLHQTIVSAEHLPGIHNRDADQTSRIFNNRTEWMISPHLLREALSLLAVNPSIDLFASRLNKQFPIFCSWKPDPDAWKIDAFSFPWIQNGLYAFPPFCLVGKVLAKVIQDKSQNLVLVTPWWPSQQWFPLMKGLAITQPRFLKETKRTLVLPHSEDLHPYGDS